MFNINPIVVIGIGSVGDKRSCLASDNIQVRKVGMHVAGCFIETPPVILILAHQIAYPSHVTPESTIAKAYSTQGIQTSQSYRC